MIAERWSKEEAWKWHDNQEWTMGGNFLPSTASNQLEMWQGEYWERQEPIIHKELEWASQLGYTAMRVFLHDAVFFHEGQEALLNRVERFLQIAALHKIRIVVVFFDGCWDPNPSYGKQPEPRPFVHNSRWVQSPGRAILENSDNHTTLKPFIQSVLRRFGNDSRVFMFDLFNEPDNPNVRSYGHSNLTRVNVALDAAATDLTAADKIRYTVQLLNQTFAWAREVGPLTTPLTVALWVGISDRLKQVIVQSADVISFHNYKDLPHLQTYTEELLVTYNRPLVCSEYMARPENSTFDPILGFLKEKHIFAFNWGFVNGRSQTIYPWDSWVTQYNETSLDLWFHDVLKGDGSPYKETEYKYIQSMADRSGILDGQSYKPALWWIVLPVIVMSLLVFLVDKVIRKRRGDREEQVNANDLEQETENELELI